jgi:hypothetical protein
MVPDVNRLVAGPLDRSRLDPFRDGQGQPERRPRPNLPFRPRSPAVPMDDSSNIRQSDAVAFKLLGRMQPLKDAE